MNDDLLELTVEQLSAIIKELVSKMNVYEAFEVAEIVGIPVRHYHTSKETIYCEEFDD